MELSGNRRPFDLLFKVGLLDCNIRLAELYVMTGNTFVGHQCEENVSRLTAELELFCGVCGESMGQIPEHLDKLPCGHLIHSKYDLSISVSP